MTILELTNKQYFEKKQNKQCQDRGKAVLNFQKNQKMRKHVSNYPASILEVQKKVTPDRNERQRFKTLLLGIFFGTRRADWLNSCCLSTLSIDSENGCLPAVVTRGLFVEVLPPPHTHNSLGI